MTVIENTPTRRITLRHVLVSLLLALVTLAVSVAIYRLPLVMLWLALPPALAAILSLTLRWKWQALVYGLLAASVVGLWGYVLAPLWFNVGFLTGRP